MAGHNRFRPSGVLIWNSWKDRLESDDHILAQTVNPLCKVWDSKKPIQYFVRHEVKLIFESEFTYHASSSQI